MMDKPLNAQTVLECLITVKGQVNGMVSDYPRKG